MTKILPHLAKPWLGVSLMALGMSVAAATLALPQDAKSKDKEPTPAKSGEKSKSTDLPAAAKPRFVDRGDYVEDTKTGLLWQKDGTASGKLNFFDAAAYAKSLKLGGLTGWRVPKADEFKAIFPAVDKPFSNTQYNKEKCCAGPGEFNSYWTSEVDGRLDDYAFVYHWYADGGKNNCFASKNFVYVRCVHDPAAPAKPAKPIDAATAKKVKGLIPQLGDDKFEVRSKATAELKALGVDIAPLLEEALKSATDAEVQARLRKLLGRLGD